MSIFVTQGEEIQMKKSIFVIAMINAVSLAHAQYSNQKAAQPELKGTATAQAAEPLAAGITSRPISTAQPAPTQATFDSSVPGKTSTPNWHEASGSAQSLPTLAVLLTSQWLSTPGRTPSPALSYFTVCSGLLQALSSVVKTATVMESRNS